MHLVGLGVGTWSSSWSLWPLNMKTLHSLETSATSHQTTERHVTECLQWPQTTLRCLMLYWNDCILAVGVRTPDSVFDLKRLYSVWITRGPRCPRSPLARPDIAVRTLRCVALSGKVAQGQLAGLDREGDGVRLQQSGPLQRARCAEVWEPSSQFTVGLTPRTRILDWMIRVQFSREAKEIFSFLLNHMKHIRAVFAKCRRW